MRLWKLFVVVLAALVPVAFAQNQPQEKKPSGNVRFSIDMLDKTIDPCTDFYAYACSKWQQQNPIPSDRPSWGRFNELQERGEYIVRDILEKSGPSQSSRSPLEQKIGDYYASCMDESVIEKAGTKPLDENFQRIAALKSKQDLAREAVRLHREGVNALFSFGSQEDFKNSTMVIAQVDQGGLGLPDRDYYFKEDAKSADLRKKYVEHVAKMFQLLGDAPDKSAQEAKAVMDIETALAKNALDPTTRRDPAKIYHKMTSAELASLGPAFNWNVYLTEVGAPQISGLNVAEPDFVKGLDGVLNNTSLDDLKTYLRWQTLHTAAPFLPAAFVQENFNFFSKELQGTKELRPRWKRCVTFTNNDLGEAVGQKYVEQTFGAEGKARMLTMVEALEKVLGQDIQTLPWMGEETKKQAAVKLAAITNRIGYPDKWRDYSSLKIATGDALGNSLRANEFEFQRQLNKIGKPVNKNDWPYPPTTVNASYNPLQNNITFPAAILQPPFFDKEADDSMNFGAIGAAIGHELTHGFDDEGSQFDAKGNLNDWWTADDKKKFEERTACIRDQYGDYVAVDDVKLNGKLTLGENTADNGGLRIAYMALMNTLAGKEPAPKDGFTAQQRFFLGFANIWCGQRTDAFTRMLATIDPHSPGRWRVNGTLSNMPEFRDAFQCKPNAAMVRQNACRVW
ncbi:MAG TPA: M13 family metallopeptidase [Terriglobales bacterium]|jgi:putative endopeptidase|nr:M13 family metallopeptidase [Terriglobales bacterium]